MHGYSHSIAWATRRYTVWTPGVNVLLTPGCETAVAPQVGTKGGGNSRAGHMRQSIRIGDRHVKNLFGDYMHDPPKGLWDE